ncbi:MAG: DUF488 family protein [Solirubrobacterales bacterium]|nr:DUF488 domain-containing protein [Solirubrobacterales bacterium]
MTEILTVGHSNHEEEEFIELLRGAGVELITDVRRYPGSRRQPHFEHSALAAVLLEAGMHYRWLGESLGGRRKPAEGSPNGGWESDQFRGYADHMASREFADGLAELERLAREQRTAVMCAEAWWVRCHRRLLADALSARGWRVLHLDARGRLTAHELTDFAVVEDGVVTYPERQTSLGL